MNKKEYFDFLKEHLPKDKYKDRFLEELEDHYEDAVYAETFTKKSAEELALTRLGDPEQTIIFYKQLMKKNSILTPYFESLFLGILSSPLFLALFIANSWTETTEVLIAKAAIGLFGGVVLWILFYFFFRAFYSRLSPLNSLLSSRGKLISFLCSLLPNVFVTILIMLMIYADDFQDYFFPILIGVYLLVVELAAWKAFKASFSRPWNLRPNSLVNHLLVGGILTLLAFTEVGSVLAYILKVIWVVISAGNLKIAIWLSGFGLSFLGLYCAYSLVKWVGKRQGLFPLFKAAVLAGSIYSLFIPTLVDPSVAENLDWERPHQEIVEGIERSYLNPFYTWSLKFRKDDGPEFDYYIKYVDGGFFIRQHGVADYLVTPVSTGVYTLSQLESDPSDPLPQEAYYLHEDLTCVLSDLAAVSHEGIAEPPTLGGETDCKELYFKDELIYENNTGEWLMLSDVVFSPDGKWLMLLFRDVMEDPARIYLVEL